jgi:hypothetical protein
MESPELPVPAKARAAAGLSRGAEAPHERAWEVDAGGVWFARRYLRLKYPVDVKVTGLKRATGLYKGLDQSRRHQITLSTYQSTEEAGRALWHELAHAKARETMGKRGFAAWNPEEREADAEAWERLQARYPVVKPRG